MKKEYRIKKNHEFSFIFEKGKSFANRQFVVYTMNKPGQAHYRVGITVSRKMGNAVERNRIKRRIREIMREIGDELIQERDYVIIARKPVLHMTYDEMKKSMRHVMKVGNTYKDKRTKRTKQKSKEKK